MYELLTDFLHRPEHFSKYTADELWTRPYLSQQMLPFHLDQSNDLASRKTTTIESAVDWIDSQLDLNGKRLCDLGCGPGLYAQRFSDKGAKVTGVDFSENSLQYAGSKADELGQDISYIHADYLSGTLPREFDIVTLIYCDFCVLSPRQRATLLERIGEMLTPGGHLVLDVAGVSTFEKKSETTLIEKKLMNGFWAEGEYVGIQRSFLYPDELLSLDRYLIIEPDNEWEIFNWFQHFTALSIEAELNDAEFKVEQMNNSLSSKVLLPDSAVIGVIARKQ